MSTEPSSTHDQRQFNQRVIEALERLHIPYGIGGSVAAMSYSKSARFTNDVDVMFDPSFESLALLVEEIERWQIYIDPLETIVEFNFPARMPINIVDGLAGTKADLYAVQHDGLDKSIMSRLQHRKLYIRPDVHAWFLSPEDVILYKLIFFKKSGGNSQKHPSDILSMLRAIEPTLDHEYMRHWAGASDVMSLWLAVLETFRE